MSASIAFFVPGIPRGGGSKRGFVNSKTGRVIITDASKHAKDWKTSVAQVAESAFTGALWHGPIILRVTFLFPRPKRHFGTGKKATILRQDAPEFHTSKPDNTKLTRSTEDALTGVVWKDDAQVCQQFVEKRYTLGAAGARITIEEM